MKFAGILLCILCFSSCRWIGSDTLPSDFNFVLKMKGYQTYSTIDSIYECETQTGEDTVTLLSFTENEKCKVYQTLRLNKFWDIPEKSANGPRISDAVGTTLEVHSDGKTKTIDIELACNTDRNLFSRFTSIVSVIDSILRTKPVYSGILHKS